jgi:hypothetical protein
MAVTMEEIVRAAHDVQRRTAHRPEVVRCAPDIGYEIMRTFDPYQSDQYSARFGDDEVIGQWPDGSPIRFPGSFDPRPGMLGMAMEVDKHLPHGVWRLCDADQTLLYDCREGKQV